MLVINIHYAACTSRPHFAPSQTSARIDFLRQGGQLVGKMGTHNVKIRTENITRCKFAGWQVARLKRIGAANNIERMGKTLFYYFYTIMFLDEQRLARRRKMCLISLYFLVLAAISAERKCVRRKKHQYYLKD